MTKDQSKILKGIAIMMMVAHHLFYQESNMLLCDPWLIYKGVPVVHILGDAFNSVRMYIVLGGYGLYTLWSKGDTQFWSRIRHLFTHYWLILAIFLPIAIYKHPEIYPGSADKIIGNIIGYEPLYNGEMWFLLPYAIVMALAPAIFKISKNTKWWIVLAIAGLCQITAYQLGIHIGKDYIFNNQFNFTIYKVVTFISNFMLGAMAARHDWFSRFKSLCQAIPYHKIICAALLILLFVAERYTDAIYARALMMLMLINTIDISGLPARLQRPLLLPALSPAHLHRHPSHLLHAGLGHHPPPQKTNQPLFPILTTLLIAVSKHIGLSPRL